MILIYVILMMESVYSEVMSLVQLIPPLLSVYSYFRKITLETHAEPCFISLKYKCHILLQGKSSSSNIFSYVLLQIIK